MKYRVKTKAGEVVVDSLLAALAMDEDYVEEINKCKDAEERQTVRLLSAFVLIAGGDITPIK